MQNWIKYVCTLVLSTLVCTTANASAYTHFWTIDGTPDGIGLVGIYEGPWYWRTQVNYGSGMLDHFWIPLHIYCVVGVLANAPILACLGFYLCRRYRRRHANAA